MKTFISYEGITHSRDIYKDSAKMNSTTEMCQCVVIGWFQALDVFLGDIKCISRRLLLCRAACAWQPVNDGGKKWIRLISYGTSP